MHVGCNVAVITKLKDRWWSLSVISVYQAEILARQCRIDIHVLLLQTSNRNCLSYSAIVNDLQGHLNYSASESEVTSNAARVFDILMFSVALQIVIS